MKNIGNILFQISLTFFLILSFLVEAWASPKVSMSLDKRELILGDAAIFTIQVEAKGDIDTPKMPDEVENFDIQYLSRTNLGRSSHVIIVNGRKIKDEKVTGGVKFDYAFIPKKPGIFTIASFPVTVDGNTYYTNPLTVEVIDEVRKSEDVFIEVTTDKDVVYLGEKITVSFDWYFRKNLDDYHIRIPWIEQFDNFLITDVEKNPHLIVQPLRVNDNLTLEVNKKSITRNGMEYAVVSFKKILIPLSEGEFILPPTFLKCNIIKGYKPKRRKSLFDDFFDTNFDSFFGGSRPITELFSTRSNALTLTVKEVPGSEKPDNYTGAVGRFDFDVSVNPTDVKVGEPIVVTAKIKGEGNIEEINLPRLPKLNNFKSYEPEDKMSHFDKLSNIKEKSFEIVLVPKIAGEYSIPPLSFSYFDTEDQAYRTLKSNAFPINVTPQPKVEQKIHMTPPQLFDDTENTREIRVLKKDIQYIKPSLGEYTAIRNDYIIGPTKILSLIILTPLPFLGFLTFWRKKRMRYEGDVSYARKKDAYKKFLSTLPELKAAIKKEDQNLFYNLLSKSIYAYISDKLNATQASVEHHMGDLLRKEHISVDIIDKLEKLNESIHTILFSGGLTDENHMRDDFKLFQKLISKLERIIK